MNEKELKHKIFWKYFFRKGRFINFKHPKLFTEKIQWLKVYDCAPVKTKLADKLAVRDWIKEQIGEKYLRKVYGVYDKYEDIDFSKFSKTGYVIKTNHGCNMQVLFPSGGFPAPCYKDIFNKFLKTNYAYKSGYEMQYDKIPPKLFVEEFIKNTNELFEYMFFCFNGEPKFILFGSGKMSDKICTTMFDTNWNNMHFNYGSESLHDENIPHPENFDEMLNIARILSKDFKFVRVDLNNINGKIYFGEMTFTPASGYMKFNPRKWDRILGDMLELD